MLVALRQLESVHRVALNFVLTNMAKDAVPLFYGVSSLSHVISIVHLIDPYGLLGIENHTIHYRHLTLAFAKEWFAKTHHHLDHTPASATISWLTTHNDVSIDSQRFSLLSKNVSIKSQSSSRRHYLFTPEDIFC